MSSRPGPRCLPRRWRGTSRALLLVAVLAACGSAAQAHITGVFLYFLKDVQGQAGDSSLGILAAQLDQTNQRIAALQPAVAQARERYQAQASVAQRKVLFYDEYASEAFAGAVFAARSPVDALADAETLRAVVAGDMEQLRATAAAYRTLRAREAELTGYRALLQAFSEAETRNRRTIAGKDTQDQELALYNVSESWEEIRAGPLARYLTWADRRLRALGTLAVRYPGDGTADFLAAPSGAPAGADIWYLPETALNTNVGGVHIPVQGVESVQFYVRADHTYLVAHFQVPLGERQIILVGQWSREGALRIRYHVEYALVDGHLIDPQDPQMQQLVADTKMLPLSGSDLEPTARLLQFQQDTGRLWLYVRHG